MICERTILRLSPSVLLMLAGSYRVSSIGSLCAMKEVSRREEGSDRTTLDRSTRGHHGRFTGLSVHRREIQIWSRKTDLTGGLRKARNGPDQLIKQTRSCRLRCLHSHAFADFCLAIKYITLTSRINHVAILVQARSALFVSA